MTTITQNNDQSFLIENFGGTDILSTSGVLESGYTPSAADAIVSKILGVVAGDDEVNSAIINGETGSNTDNGVLYGKISVDGSDNVVELYTDSARSTGLVASGTDTSKAGGDISLTAENTSGLTATINIDASASADATWTVTLREEISKYDADDLTGIIAKGIVKHYDSDADTLEIYTRASVTMEGIGTANVDDIFDKETLIDYYREVGIEIK